MSRKFKSMLHEIHRLPMAEQQHTLENRLQEWMGDHRQVDDVLVIGVHLP